MKPHDLSPELEAVVGRGPMPRSEVVSKIWAYIKAHHLQDSKNKRTINPDEKLGKVFGSTAPIDMMKMAKHVSKNLVS